LNRAPRCPCSFDELPAENNRVAEFQASGRLPKSSEQFQARLDDSDHDRVSELLNGIEVRQLDEQSIDACRFVWRSQD
jgi:hypothetical protein